MRMKEDHMKMTHSRLLIIFKSLLKTNFFFTMMSSQIRQIPRLFSPYLKPLKTVVADAGYGSEESLLRLDEKEVNHLMKYAMFDQEQKRGDTQSSQTSIRDRCNCRILGGKHDSNQYIFWHCFGTQSRLWHLFYHIIYCIQYSLPSSEQKF